MSNIKLIFVFYFYIFCNLIINININSNMDTKSTSSNTINNQQEPQSQSQSQSQSQTQNQYDDIYSEITLCKFCTAKLSYGMDSNSMVHCQECHNVWDGFAQCRCDFWLN